MMFRAARSFARHEKLAKAVDVVADEYRKGKKHEKARDLYRYAIERISGGAASVEARMRKLKNGEEVKTGDGGDGKRFTEHS